MRAFWWGLAAVHIRPTGVVSLRVLEGASIGDCGALALLVAVTALFMLKALDVRVLRLRNAKVDLVVFAIAAALVHGDIVQPAGRVAIPVETTTAVVAAVGGAALAGRRVRRSVATFLRGLAGSAWLGCLLAPRTGFGSVWRPICVSRTACCCALARAPPARVC